MLSVMTIWPSTLYIDCRACVMDLPIFVAVEAQFTGRIETAVAMVAPVQQGNGLGKSRAVEKLSAIAVSSVFANEH